MNIIFLFQDRAYIFHEITILTYFPIAGGWNTNPNATVFAGIFRCILFRCGVRPNLNGNVVPQDGTELLTAETDEDSNEDPPLHLERLSLYSEDVVSYIAGWIARKLQTKLKCMECALSLTSLDPKPKYSLLSIKDNGGLMLPSNDLRQICIRAEKIYRLIERPNTSRFTVELMRSIKTELFRTLFKSLEEHHYNTINGIDSHVTSLVRLICAKFFNLRQHHKAKRHNLHIHEKRMRSVYGHMLHYAYHQ